MFLLSRFLTWRWLSLKKKKNLSYSLLCYFFNLNSFIFDINKVIKSSKFLRKKGLIWNYQLKQFSFQKKIFSYIFFKRKGDHLCGRILIITYIFISIKIKTISRLRSTRKTCKLNLLKLTLGRQVRQNSHTYRELCSKPFSLLGRTLLNKMRKKKKPKQVRVSHAT